MTQLLSRLRQTVRSLGNEGALANIISEMGQAAAARHAVDQLELRMALVAPAPMPRAA
jgi:hypothetical protein